MSNKPLKWSAVASGIAPEVVASITCSEAQTLLPKVVERAAGVDSTEVAKLRAHLVGCTPCREIAAKLRFDAKIVEN